MNLLLPSFFYFIAYITKEMQLNFTLTLLTTLTFKVEFIDGTMLLITNIIRLNRWEMRQIYVECHIIWP